MELITGHGREAVLGRSALEGFPEFRLSDFTDLLHRALAGTPVSTEDVQYMRPGSDEPSMLWCRFSPLRNSDGTIAGVVGTVTDVTHRKSLERELRESEETLRNVIDTMGDALMISDLQGKVWEVNREFSALTGFARGDVIGATFPYPWLVEEEMPRYVVWLGALREQKFLRDFDMTWKQATGRTVAISLNTTLLRNALGEPVAMLNLARNISERRHLADALSAKSRQIEMLNRIISQANSTMEFPRIFDLIAEEVLALTTYDHMSVRLLTPDGEHLVVHGGAGTSAGMPGAGAVLDLKSSVSALAVARRESVTISDMQAPIPKVDDPVLTASGLRSVISLPIMFDENVLGVFELYWAAKGASSGEELEYLQPIADQIGALIDRTQLFQRVSDDSAYIHNLLDSIESVVYTVDQTSTVREVNKAWRDFAVLQGTPGLIEQSAVIGRPLEDVVAYEPLKVELRQIMPKLFDGTMREFSREFELTAGEQAKRSYQLGVTPMAVTGQVTGLVFTYTDITESKRAEAEIKRRNEELMTLNEVASSINKSLNLEEVLSIATERVSALVRSDMVLCYLLDEHGEAATLAAHRGIDSARAHLLQRLPVPESGVASGSVQGSFTLVTEEGGIDAPLSEASRAFLRNSGARSLLVCPLESKDRTLGALVVGFVEPRWSTEQEHRLLRLVANQLGSALENVQLYSEVQAQVRRVTLLYEIGKGLTGALDKKTILTVVHDHLKNSLGFDTFAYFEWSTKTRTARVLFELPAGDGIDPHDPAINATGDGAPFIGVSAKGESLLAVPVRQKVGVMGIIALIARNADAFSVSQLRLLESIGNLTEIAIDRASLYEDTVAKSEEIELRNKELDDFTYVVSHDLKEPLITIEGYSKIVMNDYQDKFDEEGRSFLNSVVQSSQRMKSLIDDLLTLSRIGRVSEMQESLSLKRVISEVLRDLEFRLKETKATVEIPPDLPAVRYNGTQLKMVFRNLIANAVKFNRSVQPSIVIGVAEGEKEYTVSVTDNGIGIERDHYDKIFVIFQRLHRTDEFRGTGAGLTIVKKIVENHHGRIWLESVVGQGSTFYFTIQR
jgi:PAS domain S-box-containing protein